MAAMRADRQILEEHLIFEATVDTATLVYFKIQFLLFSRGHRQCFLVICPL